MTRLLLLAAASACAHAPPESTIVSSAERAAILAALDDAFARSDAAALRARLFDNAVYCFPGAKEKNVAGAEKISAMPAALHKLRPDVVLHYVPDEVEVAKDGTLASERGRWIERWTEKDGPTELRGPYLGMWRRDGAEWKLQSLVFIPTECDGKSYCAR